MKSQHDQEAIAFAATRNAVVTGENVPLGTDVMRCKMKLHHINDLPHRDAGVRQNIRMGAVWEGSSEAQAESENAIFGRFTPSAEFSAVLTNEAVLSKLEIGASYIVTFTKAEQQ